MYASSGNEKIENIIFSTLWSSSDSGFRKSVSDGIVVGDYVCKGFLNSLMIVICKRTYYDENKGSLLSASSLYNKTADYTQP